MKNYIKFLLLLLAVFSISLSSCKKTGCTDPASVNYDPDAVKDDGDCKLPQIILNLKQMVGNKELVYGDVYNVNGVDVKFSLSQYYFSNARFMTDGVAAPILKDGKSVYMLSKPDQETFPLGELGKSHQHMFAFGVGIDAETNGQSEVDFAAWPSDHPLSLQSPAMHWNWMAGYIFLKIEGIADANGDGTFDANTEAMVYHVGLDKLYREVKLEVHADVDVEEKGLNVELDVASLLSGLDLTLAFDRDTHTSPPKDGIAKIIADNIPTAFKFKN